MFSTRIFRSRWVALLWAAGIIWTAIDVAEANKAPPPPASNASDAANATDALGQPVTNQDLAILANAMHGSDQKARSSTGRGQRIVARRPLADSVMHASQAERPCRNEGVRKGRS